MLADAIGFTAAQLLDGWWVDCTNFLNQQEKACGYVSISCSQPLFRATSYLTLAIDENSCNLI